MSTVESRAVTMCLVSMLFQHEDSNVVTENLPVAIGIRVCLGVLLSRLRICHQWHVRTPRFTLVNGGRVLFSYNSSNFSLAERTLKPMGAGSFPPKGLAVDESGHILALPPGDG